MTGRKIRHTRPIQSIVRVGVNAARWRDGSWRSGSSVARPVTDLPPMANTFDLSVPCGQCDKATSIRFEDWNRSHKEPPQEATWTCPHCGSINKLGAVGVATVVEQHADDPAKTEPGS